MLLVIRRILVVIYSLALIACGFYVAITGAMDSQNLMIPFRNHPELTYAIGLMFIAGGILAFQRPFRNIFWGGMPLWKEPFDHPTVSERRRWPGKSRENTDNRSRTEQIAVIFVLVILLLSIAGIVIFMRNQ